ncbi:hypothetical protein LguiB_005916 [Lonicera macranthoides]
MSRKLKKIRSRLEDIDADRKQFELIERAPDSLVSYPLREQTHSFGFIQSDDGSWKLDAIGNQYFIELLSRSFFQCKALSSDNVIIKVKMHDLVHDLVLSVAGKEVSHVKYDARNIFEGTLHLLFSASRFEVKEFPHFLLKLNKVRSFSFHFMVGPISKTFLDTLIKTFNCLRILQLSGSEFEELPSSVGTLKHLSCVMLQDLPRYFGNLSSLRSLYLTSKMTSFPKKGHAEGFRSLQHLQFERSCDLESLLGEMKNLTALRILSIYNCPSLISLPTESMRYLTSLETLWILKCEKLNLLEEDDMVMELPRGLLSLALWDIPKLKELPRGFKNAAATLKYIRIMDCPSFEMNLSRKCKREMGEYWPWISQIPKIHLK